MVEGPVAEIVEGADAPRGLPDRGRLPLPVRAIVGVSATADLALRTYASTLLATTALPWSVANALRGSERDALRRYAALAEAGDADATFVRPARGVDVRRRSAARLGLLGQPGRVDLLRFRSDFEPVHPAARRRYASHTRNRIARAQHWRHGDELRPTIIVVHGFMGDPYWLNSAFFSLPWFFSHGYDVLMVTLPFHGARSDALAPFSGHGLFAHGLAHINEAMFQAIHDIRVLMDHLEDRGVERFGATGLSLGGYTTALLAAVEDRLHFAIPNAAVSDMGAVMREWQPAGALVQAALPLARLHMEDLDAALASHSPLTYAPKVAKRNRFVIAGLGDRLAPPEHSERLWEHWDRCALHWFPGNHVLHVNRAAYLRRMGRFLNDIEFSPTTAA
jgi:esterase/lipase